MIMICRACRREITDGQNVVKVYRILRLAENPSLASRLDYNGFNHANCFDATGPRYNDDGSVIPETSRGYVKGLTDRKQLTCPECVQGKHSNCFGVSDITDEDVSIPCFCYENNHWVGE